MDPNTPPTADPTTPPVPADPPAGGDSKAPKWDGEFDPDRAARLVENLRSENATLKARAAEFEKAEKERADAEKTEAQRLADRLAATDAELRTLRRESLAAKAASKHGLPESLFKYLTADTEEALEAQAAELAEFMQSKRPADDLPGKPKPKLVPGNANPATDETFDADALAARIRNSN